ncbi:hypothetical protein STEG23_036055, partial [Scotinomys teguina]
MQKVIDGDAQTRPLPTFKEVANQNRNRRWWTCCLGCGSQEEEELPPLVVTCDSVTSYKNKVSSGDLSAIVKQDTSPGDNVGEHDRRRSKETSAKEPEQRNEKVVRSNEEVHLNTSQKPSCSELKPPRQQRLILQQSVPFHAAENEIPEQKTSISEVNPPGQQQPIFIQPLQINAVNDRPKEKSSISEAMPLKQMKSINKSSESIAICEEVDISKEQKSLSRLSEKRDPDVPGTRIKDNDSTSCIKKMTEDQDKTECDSYSVESNDERLTRLADAQHAFAKKINKKKRECIETSGSNTHDDAVLPSNSQGRTHSMKMTEDQDKTECDSYSVESNDERLTRLADAQHAFAKKINKKKRECIETSGSNTHDDAVLPSNSQGRTHSMKMTEDQEKTECDSYSLESNDERLTRLADAQHAFAKKINKKNRECIETSWSNTHDDAVLPSNSQGRTHSMKMTEDQDKTECDSYSLESNDERLTRLADAQHAFAKKINKKNRECIETSWSNTHDDAVLPSNSQGRTHSMKMTEDQDKTECDSYSLESNDERLTRLADAQHAFAKKINKKNRECIETSGSNTHDDAVLPSNSQGRTHSMKMTEDQEKTECDSYSLESNDERLTRLADAQHACAKKINKKKRECIETSGSNTHDDAVLPSNSQGRTHSMQKMSMKQEYTSRQSDTLLANKTREELCIQKTAIQNAYIINLIKKDIKMQMRKMYEESESNICSNRVSISKKPKEKAYLKKMTEDEDKTECDSYSVESNDERLTSLADAQHAFAKKFNRKERECIETSGSNTHDDAVLPSNSQGRTHSMQKMSMKQEYTSRQSDTLLANKTREELCIQKTAIQNAYIINLIKKDIKMQMRKMYEESESNICSNRVSISKKPKEKAYLKQKMSTKQEYTSTQSETPFANKTKEEICIEMSAIQQANILKLIRKDNKRQMYKMYEESESNVSSNRGPISKMPKENAYLK